MLSDWDTLGNLGNDHVFDTQLDLIDTKRLHKLGHLNISLSFQPESSWGGPEYCMIHYIDNYSITHGSF